MLTKLAIILLRFIIGTSLALLGAYYAEIRERKKKLKTNKMSRKFDTLNNEVQNEIIITAIEYAKADIAAMDPPPAIPPDVIEHAVGFGEMYLLEESDFAGYDPDNYTAWVGPIPPHRPKTW